MILFKMKFPEEMQDIKPVSPGPERNVIVYHCVGCEILLDLIAVERVPA